MKKKSGYFLFIGLLLAFNAAIAQKLPKLQEVSVYAPANVKIDGKATEWKTLQAFNTRTNIYFTLANDNDKLYLVVKAADVLTIRKIIAGGITLTINPDKEADHNNAIAVTYPLFSKKNWPVINLRDKPKLDKDSVQYRKQLDSFMRASNQQLAERSKEIKLKGAPGLTDSLVSVYNDEGIKAASQFDRDINYVTELAVPFKYLGLAFNGQKQFRYNIKLNGSNYSEGTTVEYIEGGVRVSSDGPRGSRSSSIADMQYIYAPTDLSGNYTLIKK